MSDTVTIETKAFAKLVLHAAKYPHCAVNGVLIADASKIKDGNRNQDLEVVDAIPLFHHSHYVTPMAEVALTQIDNMVQAENQVVVGYYAACENFNDNSIEDSPGQKIAEKIAEMFPGAIFIVIDNKKLVQQLDSAPVKLHKWNDGKWKPKPANSIDFQTPYALETVSHLLQRGVQKDLVDFDNYLDDLTMDWTNLGIEKLVASLNASNSVDFMDKNF
ncbi:unnamed protein product [Plutella xylostella]|uniref:(diamondback moth) hypothetical protein n=1 Tax=Plutella xylostella TaxID=51655 RepID=A0A8S4D426_PLUXY|nr:unnamed protein product [Plutella xylostella]